MTAPSALSNARGVVPFSKNLRRWNLAIGALHLVQGILMLSITSSFSLPVTAAFVSMNQETKALEPRLETLFDVRLGPVIASFLFLSALAHIMISLPGIYEWYRANLNRRVNYARWAEYAFSSSVMILVIAMLVGIYDIVSLTAIFGLNAAMILFGWAMERHNQSTESTDWTAYIFGSFVGIIPWIGIAIYLAGAGGSDGGVPPSCSDIRLDLRRLQHPRREHVPPIPEHRAVAALRLRRVRVRSTQPYGKVAAGMASLRWHAPTQLTTA